jgi:hypothetical protein
VTRIGEGDAGRGQGIAQGCDQPGVGEAGADGVHRDVVRLEELGERPGQADEGMLGRGVVQVGERHEASHAGRDEDGSAAGPQVRQRRVRPVHDAVEVDLHAPLVAVGIEVLAGRRAARHADVQAYRVQAAEGRYHLADGGLVVGEDADVSTDEETARGLRQLLAGGLVGVGGRHVMAGRREMADRRGAESVCSASDQDGAGFCHIGSLGACPRAGTDRRP